MGDSPRETRWEAARAKHGGRQLVRSTVGGSSREIRWEVARAKHGGSQDARSTVGDRVHEHYKEIDGGDEIKKEADIT